MVRRSRRTTLGVASFGLSSPWILISSWTNSRFLSARSAFAFSIPTTMATGQKRGRGRLSGGGIESAGAGVSGIQPRQGVSERRRFDREVNAPDDDGTYLTDILQMEAPVRTSLRPPAAIFKSQAISLAANAVWRLPD